MLTWPIITPEVGIYHQFLMILDRKKTNPGPARSKRFFSRASGSMLTFGLISRGSGMFRRLLHLKSEKGDGYDMLWWLLPRQKALQHGHGIFGSSRFFFRLEFSTMVRWSLQAPTRCWWRRTGYAVSIRELQQGLVSECAESIRIPWFNNV